MVGGPSVTDPIEKSKGFEFALLSFHENRAELEKYQASKEHHWYVGEKRRKFHGCVNISFVPQGYEHVYVPV